MLRARRAPCCHLIIHNPLCLQEGPCLAALHPGISDHLSDGSPRGSHVGANYRSVCVRAVRSSERPLIITETQISSRVLALTPALVTVDVVAEPDFNQTHQVLLA